MRGGLSVGVGSVVRGRFYVDEGPCGDGLCVKKLCCKGIYVERASFSIGTLW